MPDKSAEELLQETCENLGSGFEKFKKSIDDRLGAEVAHREELERKLNRQRLQGIGGSDDATIQDQPETWIDLKTNRPVPVLSHKQQLFDPTKARRSENGFPSNVLAPNVGRFLRGIVVGGDAPDARKLAEERKAMEIVNDANGGYTVHSALADFWIDLMRAQMVLSRAGARTVPMETNELLIAKLTSDPTIVWHQENAGLTDSSVNLGSVRLAAKTCVGLVKFSLELAQDSANIEEILQTALTKAMANAIDGAGLNGVTTDVASAPAGIFGLSGRNTVTAVGAPTSWDFAVDGMYELMADNVDTIGPLVAHPALWKKMTKLKTGLTNDNTPLPAPAEVAALKKLWTTAAPLSGNTTSAAIANWRDLLFGVRKAITVQVLREALMGTNLQLAMLVYARVDFAATRPASFCTIEGITV